MLSRRLRRGGRGEHTERTSVSDCMFSLSSHIVSDRKTVECLEKLIVMCVWGWGVGWGGGGGTQKKKNKTKIHIIKKTKTYTNNNTRITKGLSAPGR